ncbi:chondroitinase family polysaccharide lyase [Zobellia uliginosa]|uniref:chondroitinase family polysaccharide lyase n=1 Tax=Zobellia uliginosa TaxID=143224 RepID=UPI0026E1A3DC|nr:chondroitinase family polysaccharide lyase [Zobellia uliginosa]MDO6518132.1 chondroitinase family polysaccharide lyase [Zobellia uliginosa]
MKKFFLFLLTLGLTPCLFSQDAVRPTFTYEDFEQGIPEGLSARGGQLELDSKRIKDGQKSLKWNWVPNDTLVFNTPIGYHPQRPINTSGYDKDQLKNVHSNTNSTKTILEAPRGFFMWIYNDKPRNQHLIFQFGRGNKVDCHFDYNLGFKGWRTVYIHYDRGDMKGVPHKDMDKLKIVAPAIGSGTFYIDVMNTSMQMLARTKNPNPQLPHIQPHNRKSTQYASLMYEFSKFRPSFQLEKLSPQLIKAMDDMSAKAEEYILPSYEREQLGKKSIADLVKLYDAYGIVREGDEIYGKPLIKGNLIKGDFADSGMKNKAGLHDWRQYGRLLLGIAKRYRSIASTSDKASLEKMFLDLVDYGKDQGFANGAGLGWIHHYSYVVREHAPAFFLMQNVLEENNRLEEVTDLMKWMYSFNQVYREDMAYMVKGRVGNDSDDAQGLVRPRLLSALVMKNSPEKVRDLRHYSSYMSNVSTAYAGALDEILKADGTVCRHAGHTLGYGGRGAHGLISVAYLLADSPFYMKDEAVGRIKKAIQTYFNSVFTPELKNPRAFDNIRFNPYTVPEHFYNLPALAALSGSSFDAEMADLYDWLISLRKKPDPMDAYWADKLNEVSRERKSFEQPKYQVMSYSSLGVKRHGNEWMTAVRGHSKYVYPCESWGPSYFAYPLFIANGFLDVSYWNDLGSTNPEKGIWINGYDWHRWPGATTVRLPYDQMITNPGQIQDEGGEYLFSDQPFVGGVSSQEGSGVFVFPFKGHDAFNIQSFSGKKSYFFFDDYVVCLGSNIKSGLKDYDVETTILQNQIKADVPLTLSCGPVSAFPYEKSLRSTKPFWMVDNRGTGYYIPSVPKNTTLNFQRKEQTNPDAHGEKEVKGKFTTVWFNHGKAPQDISYSYAIMADSDPQKMAAFASAMKGKDKPYEIVQQDEKAHIVKASKLSSTAYAIYDESLVLKKGKVTKVNRPATFVVKEESDGIKLALSDPDFNIYEGQDDRLPDGSRVELAVYGREWFYWPTRPTTLQLTLKGQWKIKEQIAEIETVANKKAKVISSSKKETVIEFECRDGLSSEVFLIQ